MKIRVVSICYNEAQMLPFYLRHYSMFADDIIIYDDNSDDGSLDILGSNPLVTVMACPFTGLNDEKMMERWAVELSIGTRFDWIMFPDIDEILYAPKGMRETLSTFGRDYDVIQSNAYNMVGDGLPSDDGRQIWEISPYGVESPIYSKAIIVKPRTKIDWCRGRHKVENCNGTISPPAVKLLHYRYMGKAHTAARNARNYDRVGSDKGPAWSNAPDYKGEHSPEWAEAIKNSTHNALEAPPWPLTKYS